MTETRFLYWEPKPNSNFGIGIGAETETFFFNCLFKNSNPSHVFPLLGVMRFYISSRHVCCMYSNMYAMPEYTRVLIRTVF